MLLQDSPTQAAERVALHLMDHAQRLRGAMAWQGSWAPSLPCSAGTPHLSTLAERRLWKLDLHATRSLLAWGAGQRRVHLMTHVPSALDLLHFQARGWRCICLVDDANVPAVHQNNYQFVVHDLCHLEKFADPEHHAAQVGFFDAVATALAHPRWRAVEGTLDGQWLTDRDAVVSDMNGSVIFLVAAVKMKLKMAARRTHAVRLGVPAPREGLLSEAEHAVYAPLQDTFLELMELPADMRDAARAVEKRRDTPQHALRLHRHLEDRGRQILSTMA